MPHSACYHKVLSQLAFIHIPWERTPRKSEEPTKLKSRLSLPFYCNSLLVWLNQNSSIRILWVIIREVSMRFTYYWRRTWIDLSSHLTSSSPLSPSCSTSSFIVINATEWRHFRLVALYTMTVSHQVATKSLRTGIKTEDKSEHFDIKRWRYRYCLFSSRPRLLQFKELVMVHGI